MLWLFCMSIVNPLMARYAERHQVALIVRAAVGERSNMMHKRREDVSALLFALLAERMPRQVTVANPTPRTAIPLVLIVAAREVVVMTLHDFLVRLTVTAFSIRKVRTACHAAGSFRFTGHCVSPSKKPSRRIASPRRLIPYPILAESIISLSTL